MKAPEVVLWIAFLCAVVFSSVYLIEANSSKQAKELTVVEPTPIVEHTMNPVVMCYTWNGHLSCVNVR